jgi:hypothetical protein
VAVDLKSALPLVQTPAAQSFQIMHAVDAPLDRHLVCDPGERNIGLRPAKLQQCEFGNIILSGHARCGRQHPVGADEIAAEAINPWPSTLIASNSQSLGSGKLGALKRNSPSTAYRR